MRPPSIEPGNESQTIGALGGTAEWLKSSVANVSSLRKLAGHLVSRRSPGPTVAQRLGFDSNARLLIINADDFGLCSAQNRAIIESFSHGLVTSASLMVPCPGFPEAREYALAHPEADLGVHLTLSSESTSNRWGPTLDPERARSLTDGDNRFWRSAAAVLSFARIAEAEAELRAQIQRALSLGIDVTHLDSHMFILHGRRADFQRLYLRLAREYSLPLRAASRILMHWAGFHSVPEQADRLGILHPDHFAVLSRSRPSRAPAMWTALIRGLPPGLTEIACHPAYVIAEPRHVMQDYPSREADFHFLTSQTARETIADAGVQLIGYRVLRDAMRCIPSIW